MKRCSNCNFPNTDSDEVCFKCGTTLLKEPPIPETLSTLTDVPPQIDRSTLTAPTPHPVQAPKMNQPLQASQSNPVNQPLQSSQPAPTTQPKVKETTEDLIAKPNPVFDTHTNISDFIHTPTGTTSEHPKSSSTTPKVSSSSQSASTNNKASSEVAATSIPLPHVPVPPLATSSPSLPKPARILPKYKSLSCLKTLSKLIGRVVGLALFARGVLMIILYPGLVGVISCIGLVALSLLFIFLGFVLSAILSWLNDVECNQRKQIELINHIYHKIED